MTDSLVFEKNKQKQWFNSLDALKVMGSCLLILGITFHILYRNNRERRVIAAKSASKNYAEELILGTVKTYI